MKTQAIIFSKNRTLQLKSLLVSLRKFSDLPEDRISVLYVSEPAFSYEPLKQGFKCRFIPEQNFLADLGAIIMRSDAEYFLFMVDDLIFRHQFSLAGIEAFLDCRPDVESFCLRLGKNIQNPPRPVFETVDNDILVWDTAARLGKYWNYFWDLSSSIYRKKLVCRYLSRCRPQKETFPNPFEYHYYACMPSTRSAGLTGLFNTARFLFRKKSNRLACFSRSRCLTQGVNLVAGINKQGPTEHFTVQELHKKMAEGYLVDYRALMDLNLTTPQPGHRYFKLVKEGEL